MIENKEEIEELTPEAQEAAKKQRSLNRVFGLLVGVAVLLFIMFVYELVLLAI